MVMLLGRLRHRRSNPAEGQGSQGNTRRPKPAPMRRWPPISGRTPVHAVADPRRPSPQRRAG